MNNVTEMEKNREEPSPAQPESKPSDQCKAHGYVACPTCWPEILSGPAPAAMSADKTARQWLCSGGGGHEDGEDGIRACSMSCEAAIELMDEFAAYREAPLKAEIERLKGALKDLEDHCISEHDCDMARLPNKLSKEERQWQDK